MSPAEAIHDAARAYVRAVDPPGRKPVLVRVVLDDGSYHEIRIPDCGCTSARDPPPPLQPASRDDDERDCRADILAVLREAGRRLTTAQILTDLERRQWLWGERTVTGHLADMVADGTIENATQARPRGYRLVAAPLQ